MIFRLTEKLAKKLKIKLTESLPAAADPLADWSAAVFTAGGLQYLLLTNTATLYSTVLPARGITHERQFLSHIADALYDCLLADGLVQLHVQFMAANQEPVTWSKSLNRSVTGSMNDLIYQAKLSFTHFGKSAFAVSDDLNMCPMGAMDYDSPREAMRTLAATLQK